MQHRLIREGEDHDYDQWSLDRLVDDYRRNSERLRSEGARFELIEQLCAVEGRLREAGVDPDEIIRDLY